MHQSFPPPLVDNEDTVVLILQMNSCCACWEVTAVGPESLTRCLTSVQALHDEKHDHSMRV